MKIKSYKKLKNNSYKITFQDSIEECILYDEVILKYNLLVKKDISKKELEECQKENERFSCYYKAIQYLTHKSHSKKEVYDYLKKQKYKEKDIHYTLQLLEEKKLINDEVYLQMFINDQIHLTNNGPKKIMRKLMDLGFTENKINEVLSQVPTDVWQEKLEHIITKKINANKKDGINKIKEKIIYSCMNEGYQKEDILSILENKKMPENTDALLKEIQKLYKKLSDKYMGSTLTYQIKGRLLQKGFSYEKIEEVLEDIKKASD